MTNRRHLPEVAAAAVALVVAIETVFAGILILVPAFVTEKPRLTPAPGLDKGREVGRASGARLGEAGLGLLDVRGGRKPRHHQTT